MKNIIIALAAICSWRTCTIVEQTISACEKSGRGTESQMLAAEVITRGPGKLFLRECVEGEEQTALNWEIGGRTFSRWDKARKGSVK